MIVFFIIGALFFAVAWGVGLFMGREPYSLVHFLILAFGFMQLAILFHIDEKVKP